MLPAITGEPGAFGNLDDLTGDHGLIGCDSPSTTTPSIGTRSPWPDAHQHAAAMSAPRPCPPFDDGGGFAFGGEKRLEIARRLSAPGRLDIAADGEQHQHHGGGVEIDLVALLDGGENGIGVGGADPITTSADDVTRPVSPEPRFPAGTVRRE